MQSKIAAVKFVNIILIINRQSGPSGGVGRTVAPRVQIKVINKMFEVPANALFNFIYIFNLFL